MLPVSCMGLLLRPPFPCSVKSFLFLVSSDLGVISLTVTPFYLLVSFFPRVPGLGSQEELGCLFVWGSTDLIICNPSSLPSHFFSLYLSCQWGEHMSLLAVIVAHVDKLLLNCHFSLLHVPVPATRSMILMAVRLIEESFRDCKIL